MSKNEYVNNHIACLESYINRLERNLKSKDNQIESLRNLNKTIKLCNSDYYNMINTLSSKLARIRELCDYESTNVESLISDILEIIDDKYIHLGDKLKGGD